MLLICYSNIVIDRYRTYQPVYNRPRQNKRPPKKHRGRRLIVLVSMVVIGLLGYKLITEDSNKSNATEQPTKQQTVRKKVEAVPISDNTWNDMKTKVDAIIAANPAINIGVSVIDDKTGVKQDYGLQEPYHGASTTKVLTAAAFLHQVEQGKYTLNTSLGGRSANEHLRLMLNRSNNESWAALNSAVGYSQLTAYAHENGINSYQYIGNLMKPSDQALLLQKVYGRKLVNEEHTALMLGYMQNTNNEDMIPVVAPASSTFYHKYGQLDDRLHDGAIIDYKKRPLIIVVYTKGGGNAYGAIYNARIQLIQTISKTIIDTFYASN